MNRIRVVFGMNTAALEAQVNELAEKGYQIQGHLTISPSGGLYLIMVLPF